MNALGIDVSHYQDRNDTPQYIDFMTAKSKGAEFVFVKASQGLATDEDFFFNWNEAHHVGLLRGAYHFYDYRKTAKPQAEYLWNLIRTDPGELPPVMDLEYFWTPYPARTGLLNAVSEFMSRLYDLCGKPPILYTNSSIIKQLSPIPNDLLRYPLWIAAYPYKTGTNEQCKSVADIPAGWKPQTYDYPRWTFWQFTSKLPGLSFGMESLDLDGDLFNGTSEQLKAFAGITTPAPEKTDKEKLDILWTNHPELH